jgi:3-hydroxybutyryl-CoA dehydratase
MIEADRRMPKYWEDFNINESYTSDKYVISEEDVYRFASLSGDFNPLHVDETYANSTIYGQRIAHNVFVQSKVMGIHHSLGFFRGSSLGVIGLEWKFHEPILIGDEIEFKVIVEELRETTDESSGIIEQTILVHNQHERPVAEGHLTYLVRRRMRGWNEHAI